jgi:hypothetical protein
MLAFTKGSSSVPPMRFRGTSGGAAHTARTAAAVAVAGVLAFASAPPAARAADPSVAPYGQVAAVGALDTGAVYLPDSTSGLTEGDFVDPVGMTATADPSVPGGEDIYVLDLVNPQAMNSLIAGGDQDTVALQYRLQKIAIAPSTTSGSDAGSETVEACTTFTLQSTSAAPDERAVSLAVDGPLNAVDVLINAMPDSFGAVSGYSIAEQVDQWTTSLGGGAPGTCPQTATPTVAVPSTSLDKAHDSGLDGDIDGDSIAFAGTGTSAELTLGGRHLAYRADHRTVHLGRRRRRQAVESGRERRRRAREVGSDHREAERQRVGNRPELDSEERLRRWRLWGRALRAEREPGRLAQRDAWTAGVPGSRQLL